VQIVIDPKISPSFHRDFPEFVPAVQELGLCIHCTGGKRVNGMPVYWLDGTYQLTGYDHDKEGRPFTKEVATRHISKLLADISEGRAQVASETFEVRFERIVEGVMTLNLRYKNFCSFRHPSGDEGTIFYRGEPVSAWVRFWPDTAREVARAENVMLAQLPDALRTSFANNGAMFNGRTALTQRETTRG
jgi:hypothetical protein